MPQTGDRVGLLAEEDLRYAVAYSHFKTGQFSLAEQHLARASESDAPLSIYFHLPFCHQRCTFCGCHVVISKKHEISRKYLDIVFDEIVVVISGVAGANPSTVEETFIPPTADCTTSCTSPTVSPKRAAASRSMSKSR